jgi:hypothetical protein
VVSFEEQVVDVVSKQMVSLQASLCKVPAVRYLAVRKPVLMCHSDIFQSLHDGFWVSEVSARNSVWPSALLVVTSTAALRW